MGMTKGDANCFKTTIDRGKKRFAPIKWPIKVDAFFMGHPVYNRFIQILLHSISDKHTCVYQMKRFSNGV